MTFHVWILLCYTFKAYLSYRVLVLHCFGLLFERVSLYIIWNTGLKLNNPLPTEQLPQSDCPVDQLCGIFLN